MPQKTLHTWWVTRNLMSSACASKCIVPLNFMRLCLIRLTSMGSMPGPKCRKTSQKRRIITQLGYVHPCAFFSNPDNATVAVKTNHHIDKLDLEESRSSFALSQGWQGNVTKENDDRRGSGLT